MPKRTSNTPPHTNKAERIRKLINLIERFGYYNIDKVALAKEWNIDRTVIYDDIKEIKKRGIDVIDMPLVRIEMHRLVTSIHATTMRKLNDPGLTEGERIGWARIGLLTADMESHTPSVPSGVTCALCSPAHRSSQDAGYHLTVVLHQSHP